MPAKTLENKLKHEIDSLYISAWLLREGQDTQPLEARLDYIVQTAQEAQAILARITKRDGRNLRAAQTTHEDAVRRSGWDSPEARDTMDARSQAVAHNAQARRKARQTEERA